jgi:hypothetical protein
MTRLHNAEDQKPQQKQRCEQLRSHTRNDSCIVGMCICTLQFTRVLPRQANVVNSGNYEWLYH